MLLGKLSVVRLKWVYNKIKEYLKKVMFLQKNGESHLTIYNLFWIDTRAWFRARQVVQVGSAWRDSDVLAGARISEWLVTTGLAKRKMKN